MTTPAVHAVPEVAIDVLEADGTALAGHRGLPIEAIGLLRLLSNMLTVPFDARAMAGAARSLCASLFAMHPGGKRMKCGVP